MIRAGDLCFTRGLPPQCSDANDRIVRAAEACQVKGEPAWRLESRVNFVMSGPGTSTTGDSFKSGDEAYFDTLQEKHLRPIRGTDAQDETAEPRELEAA